MEKQKVYIARVSSRYGSWDQAIFSEKKLAELWCSLKKPMYDDRGTVTEYEVDGAF